MERPETLEAETKSVDLADGIDASSNLWDVRYSKFEA